MKTARKGLRRRKSFGWQSFLRRPAIFFIVMLTTSASVRSTDLPDDKYLVEKEIFVQMRDGVHLDTDVLRPKGIAGKIPTVLVRTPYEKVHGEWKGEKRFLEMYLNHGYAVVLQNERGRYFSEGKFNNFLAGASTDGYDTAQWIINQPWSNEKIGTIGCSSSSETQWPMAASNPPGYAAMIPTASGMAVGNIPGNATHGANYRGGVPVLDIWPPWYASAVPAERIQLPSDSSREQRLRIRNTFAPIRTNQFFGGDPQLLMHLPSKDILRNVGAVENALDNYLTWGPADKRWNAVEHISAGAAPRVPALIIDTWHDDLGAVETTRLFKYLQDQGTPNVFLVMGAGQHCALLADEMRQDLDAKSLQAAAEDDPNLKVSDLAGLANAAFSDLKVGDLEVGDARYRGADDGFEQLYLHWFDYWLKGDRNGVTEMPQVQLYVMGKGWISGDRWPLKQTQFTNYYLDGGPQSGPLQQAGSLSTPIPERDGSERYLYDPAFPVPTTGGGMINIAARDQRSVEIRKDVLVYETLPLETPMTIAGPVEAVLYVSSSAKDTDFMVKLVDIYPDGKAINLAQDAFRVRYREGFDKKVLMQPGEAYRITLPNMVTAIRLPKGHRIAVQISSSDFPLYERNLNTGGNNYDETKWVVAENVVHHGERYPSHIVLPILPE